MEHIAKTFEHIVLKVEPWELIDLSPTWHIATNQPFDIYTDRDEAINAIKAEYPDFEPPEWEQQTMPSEVRTGHLLVALYQQDIDTYNQLMQVVDSDPVAKIALQHEHLISRTSTMLAQIQKELGLSDEYIDSLFYAADILKL
jgi:hypothetical protein